MEIFTSAPRELDSRDSREVGKLGSLRVVAVDGMLTDALEQLTEYRVRGFFASVHRSDALGYLVEKEALERRLDNAFHDKWKAKILPERRSAARPE